MRWIIGDLKGIIPIIYMHKILMEDDHKPVVQPKKKTKPINEIGSEKGSGEVVGYIFDLSNFG